MARPRKHPHPQDFRWVTLGQIAKEIDRTPKQTLKLLDKLGWIGIKARHDDPRAAVVYDAHALEVIKGLLNHPHRDVGRYTWLDDYLDTRGVPNYGTRGIRPGQRDPGPPGKT